MLFQRISSSRVISLIRPLDVLLFRGGDLVSDAIRTVEQLFDGAGKFSHVGLVITHEIAPSIGLKPGVPYVWEITMSGKIGDGVYDWKGRSMLGVQIRLLSSVLDVYADSETREIAWVPLKVNPWTKSVPNDLVSRVEALVRETLGDSYRSVCCCLCALTGAAVNSMKLARGYRKDPNRFFCSEFVAYVLRSLDLIPPEVLPDTIMPEDFIPEVGNKKGLDITYNPIYIRKDASGRKSTLDAETVDVSSGNYFIWEGILPEVFI